MQPLVVLQLLVLLALANGVPVLAKRVMGGRLSYSVDCGMTFIDGRPLLGPSKTIRGVVLSVVVTTLSAPVIGLDPIIGAVVAATAVLGDLFSSFVKRRMNLAPSSQALGLDQVPESLFPLLACRKAMSLGVIDMAAVVVIFFAGELVVSRLLYRLRIRDQPY